MTENQLRWLIAGLIAFTGVVFGLGMFAGALIERGSPKQYHFIPAKAVMIITADPEQEHPMAMFPNGRKEYPFVEICFKKETDAQAFVGSLLIHQGVFRNQIKD